MDNNVRQGENMQLASLCGFPDGTYMTVPPATINNGFRLGQANVAGAAVRFPDGTYFAQGYLGEAVAFAESQGCTITFESYYQLLHGGLEALQNATTAGLPGFAVVYDSDGAGEINGVHIWAPNADYYRSYHHLASLGINTATIRCPFWLQRRRLAVENHFFPDNGWATGPTRGSHFYAPNGDEFRGTLDAWITAGVVLPPHVVMQVVNDYRRIVKELSVRNSRYVMSTQAICDLVGGRVNVRTMGRFLESGNANFSTIYPISTFFREDNAAALERAAIAAGMSEEDIPRYNDLMAAAMDRREQSGLYNFELPVPARRADPPTHGPVAGADANPLQVDEVDPLPLQVDEVDPLPLQVDEVDPLPPIQIDEVDPLPPIQIDEAGLLNIAEV